MPSRRPFDPAAPRGLKAENFRRIAEGGFGDPHNSYPHSMGWFKNKLYVGTTRMTQITLQVVDFYKEKGLPVKLVEGPDTPAELYKMDRRAQLWCYDPETGHWEMVFQSPMIMGSKDFMVAREVGYRGMAVFQGESDPEPVLYVATWAPGLAPGPIIIRSEDGKNFTKVSDWGILGLPVTTTRLLIPFKGGLFTSPTGTKGDCNFSSVPVIYVSRDPANGNWVPASSPGFGDETNEGVWMMCVFNDYLYAGTVNCQGFQVWRTDGEGKPPFHWTLVVDKGAYRGPKNQCAFSMEVFKDALFVGTGIMNGGFDVKNNIGPAGSEVIRINADGSWDLIVGLARDTPKGRIRPLSSLTPGFNNLFNGYFWRMAVHEDWLYLCTCNILSLLLYWSADLVKGQHPALDYIGIDTMVNNQSGFEIWRTWDGESWLPVTKNGFGNRFNIGGRNMISTKYGLFIGVPNPFAPRVAIRRNGQWQYFDNRRGGLEVWLGSRKHNEPIPHVADFGNELNEPLQVS